MTLPPSLTLLRSPLAAGQLTLILEIRMPLPPELLVRKPNAIGAPLALKSSWPDPDEKLAGVSPVAEKVCQLKSELPVMKFAAEKTLPS